MDTGRHMGTKLYIGNARNSRAPTCSRLTPTCTEVQSCPAMVAAQAPEGMPDRAKHVWQADQTPSSMQTPNLRTFRRLCLLCCYAVLAEWRECWNQQVTLQYQAAFPHTCCNRDTVVRSVQVIRNQGRKPRKVHTEMKS